MRKVIGIGETILDIIFRGDQPSAAVPGGSVFNGIVSLGRMGINVGFISETGNDRVGNIILQFMRENHIPTDHVNVFPDGKSPVSLAFLNEQSDAEYIFYKDYPKQRLDVLFPKLEEDDIVMVGSYYALNPVLREKILELLDQAREKKAIIYYDPNFRSSHKNEAMKLAPTIIENLEYADIVRGSLEDFLYLSKFSLTNLSISSILLPVSISNPSSILFIAYILNLPSFIASTTSSLRRRFLTFCIGIITP